MFQKARVQFPGSLVSERARIKKKKEDYARADNWLVSAERDKKGPIWQDEAVWGEGETLDIR